jgi:hypothetical protein
MATAFYTFLSVAAVTLSTFAAPVVVAAAVLPAFLLVFRHELRRSRPRQISSAR